MVLVKRLPQRQLAKLQQPAVVSFKGNNPDRVALQRVHEIELGICKRPAGLKV